MGIKEIIYFIYLFSIHQIAIDDILYAGGNACITFFSSKYMHHPAGSTGRGGRKKSTKKLN